VPKVHTPAHGTSGRGRFRRASSSLAEINVVPLVDVMLVLLIIFMVTAPMIQRGIDVKLPESSKARAVEGERIFVTVPASFRADGRVFLGDEQIRLEVLSERVRQKVEFATDKKVYLRGDGTVQYQDIMTIIDSLKNAGVTDVGMVAKAPGDR
jgi:biopolymer transport protein TolR